MSYLRETEIKYYNNKIKDTFQLSLYYFLFGFSQKQKSGFPLFSLPLCELNENYIENTLKMNIPTDIPPDINGYTEMFTEIYNKELNDLIIKTKSLTIFLKYQYLATFDKMINVVKKSK